jgi:hypothetical protein
MMKSMMEMMKIWRIIRNDESMMKGMMEKAEIMML